ncbi:MAG: hypothetical protein LBP92_11335, partial [Deltaproteobacteria bacterium]|nr:hypothetical protein [Deltaproteobacteria bacterium]
MQQQQQQYGQVAERRAAGLPGPPLPAPRHMVETMGATVADLGVSRAFMSFNGKEFWIKSGGSKERLTMAMSDQAGRQVLVPRRYLDVVLVALAPDRHCLYYDDAYRPGSDAQPSAVWWRRDGAPEWVPTAKIVVDGREKFPYQTKQRCVAALYDIETDQVRFDEMFGMDVSAQGLFGKAGKGQGQAGGAHALSFVGLSNLCHRGGFLPCHFPVRLTFADESVPVLRFTPLVRDGTNNIHFLSARTLETIYRLNETDEIRWYLDPVSRQAEGLDEAEAGYDGDGYDDYDGAQGEPAAGPAAPAGAGVQPQAQTQTQTGPVRPAPRQAPRPAAPAPAGPAQPAQPAQSVQPIQPVQPTRPAAPAAPAAPAGPARQPARPAATQAVTVQTSDGYGPYDEGAYAPVQAADGYDGGAYDEGAYAPAAPPRTAAAGPPAGGTAPAGPAPGTRRARKTVPAKPPAPAAGPPAGGALGAAPHARAGA